MSSGGATARVPGRSVVVADTVGAGDTFQAATLSRLAETNRLSRAALDGMSAQDLGELLDFAVRAAAVTCTRRGADLPRRADLGLPPLSR